MTTEISRRGFVAALSAALGLAGGIAAGESVTEDVGDAAIAADLIERSDPRVVVAALSEVIDMTRLKKLLRAELRREERAGKARQRRERHADTVEFRGPVTLADDFAAWIMSHRDSRSGRSAITGHPVQVLRLTYPIQLGAVSLPADTQIVCVRPDEWIDDAAAHAELVKTPRGDLRLHIWRRYQACESRAIALGWLPDEDNGETEDHNDTLAGYPREQLEEMTVR